MEIYLDNSATTKPIKVAVDACLFALEQEYGNPSSLHKRGFLAEQLCQKAREQIAKSLCCNTKEIYFTSGATEANNLAVIGGAMAKKRSGNHIIVTAIEHPSVRHSAQYLCENGFEVTVLMPNESGEYTPQMFLDALTDKTILVSFMYVNNETGLVLPIDKIAAAVRKANKDILIHVDAVQGFLKLPIKLKNSAVDLLSISGHKVYAPKGVGALYIKRGVRILHQSYGGSHECGMRAGTEAVPLISAFGAAVCEQADKLAQNSEHYVSLKKHLLGLAAEIPEVCVNSCDNCAPHIVNISVKGVRSEVMLHFMEQHEIYISSGSACAKGEQSYVLKAFGLDKSRTDTAIRISFSPDTTKGMLDELAVRLKEAVSTLAKIR